MTTGCEPRRYGLRLTIRHQLILVCYWSLIFTILNAFRTPEGSLQIWRGLSLALLLTPWILGVLVMAFDRPGPLRNWAVSSLLMLFSPVLAIHHDCGTLAAWMSSGQIPNALGTLAFNVFFVGAYVVYWHQMGPATCPNCERWSLIPLMRLWGQPRRTSNTRWCAACGALYWRHQRGPWRPERRRTWLDDRKVAAVVDDDSAVADHQHAPSSV